MGYSNGRPPKIEVGTLKRLWAEYQRDNPKGTKAKFCKDIGMTQSWLNTLLKRPDLPQGKISIPKAPVADNDEILPAAEGKEEDWTPAKGSDLLVFWT